MAAGPWALPSPRLLLCLTVTLKPCSFPCLNHSIGFLLSAYTFTPYPILTRGNFLADHVPFPSGFFHSCRQFDIPTLTHSPIFIFLTTAPKFFSSPVSQPTPILTLDSLVPTEGLWNPRKQPTSGSSPAFRLTFRVGWASQGLGSGDLEFGDVSFSLAKWLRKQDHTSFSKSCQRAEESTEGPGLQWP